MLAKKHRPTNGKSGTEAGCSFGQNDLREENVGADSSRRWISVAEDAGPSSQSLVWPVGCVCSPGPSSNRKKRRSRSEGRHCSQRESSFLVIGNVEEIREIQVARAKALLLVIASATINVSHPQ